MIDEKELNDKIEKVCNDFEGQLDDLYSCVGFMVVGRHYGWRVMRLVSSRRHWSLASKHFGDPKELLPEKGDCYSKSIGMRIIDQAGDYWSFIRGQKSLDQRIKKAIQ